MKCLSMRIIEEKIYRSSCLTSGSNHEIGRMYLRQFHPLVQQNIKSLQPASHAACPLNYAFHAQILCNYLNFTLLEHQTRD